MKGRQVRGFYRRRHTHGHIRGLSDGGGDRQQLPWDGRQLELERYSR